MNVATGSLHDKTQMEVRLRIKNGDKEAMSMGLVINKESEGMQKRKTCRKDSSQPLR